MTVCVSIRVSEGLVLGADSTATIQGSVEDGSGKKSTGILKTYDNARKLSHLKDYPIATLTWGIYLIGSRSVESIIKEYEYALLSLTEEEEKIRDIRMSGKKPDPFVFDVKGIAQGLLDHILKIYNLEFGSLKDDQKPPLGLLVSGFSSNKFFPDQWLIMLPASPELKELRPDENSKPSFGANWFGLTDAIIRFHWGRDEEVIKIISTKYSRPIDEVRDILNQFQYPIPFEGMPLQDAIDYATFLINLQIGRFRFVVGAPLCGGKIDIAVLTPNAFTWINRKTWKA